MIKIILGTFLICLILVVTVVATKAVWDECRASGHSTLYCVRMVAR